jgi:hypothetical protein
MTVNELPLLAGSPLVVLDGIVEVVVVALPALLTVPANDMKLLIHGLGNLRPFLDVPGFVKLLQDAVLLHRARSTISVHAFLSLIKLN